MRHLEAYLKSLVGAVAVTALVCLSGCAAEPEPEPVSMAGAQRFSIPASAASTEELGVTHWDHSQEHDETGASQKILIGYDDSQTARIVARILMQGDNVGIDIASSKGQASARAVNGQLQNQIADVPEAARALELLSADIAKFSASDQGESNVGTRSLRPQDDLVSVDHPDHEVLVRYAGCQEDCGKCKDYSAQASKDCTATFKCFDDQKKTFTLLNCGTLQDACRASAGVVEDKCPAAWKPMSNWERMKDTLGLLHGDGNSWYPEPDGRRY